MIIFYLLEKCSETMNQVLTVMKCVAQHLTVKDRDILITDLRGRLMKFESPPDLISVSISTLSKVCLSFIVLLLQMTRRLLNTKLQTSYKVLLYKWKSVGYGNVCQESRKFVNISRCVFFHVG